MDKPTNKRSEELEIEVVETANLSLTARKALVDLINRAYEEDLAPYLDTFHETIHLFGYLGEKLVSHAAWITRWLQVADGPLLRCAYVELVATDPAYRGRGYASRLMRRLAGSIGDFDIAALSPSSAAFYERLGWELWRGPLFARRADHLEPSPGDEEVMILRLPKTPPLDLRSALSVEWREFEVW